MASVERDWERRIGARLKLRDIHILSKVVEWRSMAKAAVHLDMSQPAVSEAIANLEAVLRVRLVERNARGVEPTIYASALLKHERVVFDELQQAIKEMEFLQNPEIGEVRIGTSEILAAGFLPRFVDRILQRHPGIFAQIFVVDTATLAFRELRDRNVDLILMRLPNSVLDHDVNIDPFFDDPPIVAAGASHPLAKRRKVTFADLARESWVFQRSQVMRSLIEDSFQAHGLSMPKETVLTDTIHIRNYLVGTGRYLTITAASILKFTGKQWSLKRLPIDLGAKPLPHAIVTLRNRMLNPVSELFVRELKLATKLMS